MIRGNYSLANELRSNERRQQERVQKLQKKKFQLKKLEGKDPIRLYWQIHRLEQQNSSDAKEKEYLKKLKNEWKFIRKNGLHKLKVDSFLKKLEKEEKEKNNAASKLWGSKSIYFNPELNPLGKPPNTNQVKDTKKKFPNLIIPLKGSNRAEYAADVDIEEMNISLPKGAPPRFYKMVQNFNKDFQNRNETDSDQNQVPALKGNERKEDNESSDGKGSNEGQTSSEESNESSDVEDEESAHKKVRLK